MESAYPELVKEFEDSKKPKTRKKKKPCVDEIDNLLKNVSISGPSKKKKSKKVHTLDSFLMTASTPKRTQNFSFNMDQSNFGDENDLEVSDIVDDIINRKLPSYIPENLDKLVTRLDNKENDNCSFFMNEMTENDLFENTFKKYCISSDYDSD